MPTTTLSFNPRVARTPRDLQAACQVRSISYGHHLPSLRTAFAAPEPLDRTPGTAVFLCTDKATGAAVGTARVQINTWAPLQIDRSVEMPDPIAEQSRAEITRLSVMPGRADPLVKLALMKASYLYCLANQIRWMVIGARSEALIRQYRRLGFKNLHEDGKPVPLAHAGGIDHWVLAFDVTAAERHWFTMNHPLYTFMVQTLHPDIQLFNAPVEVEAALDRQEAIAA